jgi:hypothetical protein
MQIPTSMMELLDERIVFCQNQLDNATDLTNIHQTVPDVVKALADYKYCKELLIKTRKNPIDRELKARFKQLATKIVADLYYKTANQESHSIPICGITFLTKRKSFLPKERQLYLAALKTAFGKIFNEIIYETTT